MQEAPITTAADAIYRLAAGNLKYLNAQKNHSDISRRIRRTTAVSGQSPYAIIVTCSDSRVIPEHIFSAGIGELFVIRLAGNVIDDHQLGSIEYAAWHLGCKLVLVLGYHKVGLGTNTLTNNGNDDSFQVVDAGVAYAFDKNVKASFDYAHASDWKDAYNDSHKDAYNVQVSYKGADAADKGSWGAYVAYRKLSPLASFGATYDYKLGADGLSSLKGWEFGADYAFAKNIVATAKFFTGTDDLLKDKDKVTGVWSRVDFLF